MLSIMLAFFGVIIAVNVVMATLASTSWTGLVVENSYVASQEFNRKAEESRAQAALGWNEPADDRRRRNPLRADRCRRHGDRAERASRLSFGTRPMRPRIRR